MNKNHNLRDFLIKLVAVPVVFFFSLAVSIKIIEYALSIDYVIGVFIITIITIMFLVAISVFLMFFIENME